jgi:hypothetical protein
VAGSDNCADDLQKWVLSYPASFMAAYSEELYPSMMYYSGKDINDLGNYKGCNDLDKANYILLDFMKSGAPIFLSYCLPSSCGKKEIEDFFVGIIEDIHNLTTPFVSTIKDAVQQLQLDAMTPDDLPFDVRFSEKEYERLQSEYTGG